MKKLLFSTLISAAMLLPATYAQDVPAQKKSIHQRKENQQDRIANGVKSGQLTAHETAQVEHKEAKVNREVRKDRVANGGKLTAREKRQVNRQQNRISKDIYKQKHDGQTQ
ncbi:MAG TPA: hypothetical protein VG675_23775 [Bryobacteraceae bacterium]|nr:hypothetical protein [Bryobacteraceae bacterium]